MPSDVDVLARTIFGEARGEGIPGMEAVASVIMNRFDVCQQHPGFWWGTAEALSGFKSGTVGQICLKPFQFSCWNKNDPNREKLLSIKGDNFVFKMAMDIADQAIHRQLKDPTHGATHYRTKLVDPKWDDGERPVARIGNHVFFRPREVPALVPKR